MSNKFNRIDCPINGLIIIEPNVFGDERGFFLETYNRKEFEKLGIKDEFVQDNHSKSRKGTLRGMHFQIKHPQCKLVRVIKGIVYDVAVDIRRGSPTYSKWFGIYLSEENKKMFYIPVGFAHGFVALTDEVEFLYKVTDYHYPEYEAGINWNDPAIGIKWPLKEYEIKIPIIKERDLQFSSLRDVENPFEYREKK